MSEERQLALLVRNAVDYAIVMLDPAGIVTSWNAGAQELKGYTREEIVGRHFSAFHTEADRARGHPAEELRIAEREGRYEEEGWRVRKDGTRFWANVVITAIRDPDGELIGFGKVSRDLTVRRLSEQHTRAKAREFEAANRELAEYRRLVTSVRDYAIFMLDPAGHVRSWNAGARRLKGYTPSEIIGRHFSTFYTEADRARDHPAHELEIAVAEGRYEEEGWRVRKDGSTFWASVTITAVRDDDGRLTGFAKVTRDLTERKRAADALERAVEELQAANEELDRFASVAAHDMTDPLRTISGFAEVLVETEPSPAQAKEYATHILDSSLRLSGMLQGLLTYARAGRSPEERVPVEVARVATQVVEDLAALIRARGADVRLDVPPGASVAADPHDLRIAVQNLVSNAIKFADPARPAVVVAAERTEDAHWRVTVTDNGRGVDPADRRTVFTAFSRLARGADQPGYGLGLAITQRLVERHGGRIGVDANPGGGGRFWFALPASDAASLPAHPPTAGQPAGAS
jgi:PAS domain S-box-containing protein